MMANQFTPRHLRPIASVSFHPSLASPGRTFDYLQRRIDARINYRTGALSHAGGFRGANRAQHLPQYGRLGSTVAEDTYETAADAVIEGRLAELQALLRDQPSLATARSQREHHATLLHYVAANGVEQYRQKSPPNAVEIANTLLEAGAEVDALADTYAGGTTETTMNLLVSSVHPREAGVQVPL